MNGVIIQNAEYITANLSWYNDVCVGAGLLAFAARDSISMFKLCHLRESIERVLLDGIE